MRENLTTSGVWSRGKDEESAFKVSQQVALEMLGFLRFHRRTQTVTWSSGFFIV